MEDLAGMNMNGLPANIVTVMICAVGMILYKKLLASKCRVHLSWIDCNEIEQKKELVKSALREHLEEERKTQRSLVDRTITPTPSKSPSLSPARRRPSPHRSPTPKPSCPPGVKRGESMV